MNARRAIAIVDDDPLVRSALASLIRSFRLEAAAFADGAAFLATASGDWACLIADVRMPGMSGLDLLRLVRARQPDLPVVVVTAFGDERMRGRALTGGASAFLEKPCDAATILAAVQDALEPPAR